MKTFLLSSIIIPLIILSLVIQAHNNLQNDALPESITKMIDTLSHNNKTVKMVYDDQKGQVFWLSFLGNLHTANQNGSTYRRINQGQQLWKDVTFIEDFCLNASKDSIYFTDLMDLQSGHSAIKITDAEGTVVKVVASLENEIPYHISFSPEQQMLFYLSKVRRNGIYTYRLRFVNLNNSEKGTLYSSSTRITQLDFDKANRAINIQNQSNEQFAFSANL
ncbi:hypothetical protein OKW21_001428 [Catalinimonas alkaloidigena]|uniref:hypothetical protein n=1 Tax=Catalinimonas alkaloidigena TaxID=1075417 RepID=UPI002405EAB3|nr:hypothetical protein [Catalinimonas alkaloidigena]MDF9796165.1 hypothetical protein [Catalinimonas alkaloidigena]